MMLLMDELKEWKNSFLSLRTCYVKEAILLLSYTVIYSAVGGQNFAICDQTVTLHYSCNIIFGASLFFRNLLRRDNALIQVCIYALKKWMSSTIAMQQIDKQRIMVIMISTIANVLRKDHSLLMQILLKDHYILHHDVWMNQYVPVCLNRDIFHVVYIWQLLT